MSMPYWSPYSLGIAFAKSKSNWINERISKQNVPLLHPGAKIGRDHRLSYVRDYRFKKTKAVVSTNSIVVTSSRRYDDPTVQLATQRASERALKYQAQLVLPEQLALLAKKYSFRYRDVRIRKLTSRWGSCSSDNVITLSYFLVQLPQALIDYVILHELNHTQHLHHGADFWDSLDKIVPDSKQLRKRLKMYQPRVIPAFPS